MSYATRLAQELRNRYDDHDRPGFEDALKRMVATMTYTGPLPMTNDERVMSEAISQAIVKQATQPCGGGCVVCAGSISTLPQVNVAGPSVPTLSVGTQHCTLAACECKTWPQAKTCMHRRA